MSIITVRRIGEEYVFEVPEEGPAREFWNLHEEMHKDRLDEFYQELGSLVEKESQFGEVMALKHAETGEVCYLVWHADKDELRMHLVRKRMGEILEGMQ